MKTESFDYKEYLSQKYLPGRNYYLRNIIFPRIMKKFGNYDGAEIYDLGCGTGEFLSYCKSKGISIVGVDSNPYLVEMSKKNGLNAVNGDILNLHVNGSKIKYAICDNVLEHLDLRQIHYLFSNLKNMFITGGIFVIIVPCRKGYNLDPTHKTFVDVQLVNELCERYDLNLDSSSYLPINSRKLGDFVYLQMSVFRIIL